MRTLVVSSGCTTMLCKVCGKPIVLVPSALERAAKDVAGNSASFYEQLFTSHADCQIRARSNSSIQLMRQIKCSTSA